MRFISLVLLIFSFSVFGQSPLDSLNRLYEESAENSLERFRAIEGLLENASWDIYTAQEMIDLRAEGLAILELSDTSARAQIFWNNTLAYRYSLAGDSEKTTQHLLNIVKLATDLNDEYWLANAYSNLALVYKLREDYQAALQLQKRSLEKRYQMQDTLLIFSTLTDICSIYYELESYDSALFFSENASRYYLKPEEVGYSYTYASLLAILSPIYARMGKYDSAFQVLDQSKKINRRLGYERSESAASTACELATILLDDGRLDMALKFAKEAYEVALERDFDVQIRNSSKVLAAIYERQNLTSQSLFYFKTYISYRDSIVNIDNVKEIESLRANFEISEKEAELEVLSAEQKTQRIILIGVVLLAVVLLTLAIIIYRYYKSKAALSLVLEQQRKSLEINNATKDKFFSIISHDLRGPIASLSGANQMVKHFVEEDEKQNTLEIVGHMEETVDSLSGLLDNLLNWAMQQRGHFDHFPKQVNLYELTEEILAMFSNMFSSKKLSLVNEIDRDAFIWVDRNTIHTVFRNLLNNAIKFTEEGGAISLSSRSIDNYVLVTLSDTGVGMSAEKLERLFKLDSEQSTYGTEGEKGLGLGLQLVYEFVQMNNGEIEVESDEGKGTSFHVKLPQAKV